MPVDHDGGGGCQGGVHTSSIGDIEGAKLLAWLDVQGSLVDLELRIRVSLQGTSKLFKLLGDKL